ncbi:MAG: hypothetical protein MUO23_13135 [Anaerolineales bacterium]|nr:hypothetical protein [Anaerolineales bacterium]
MTPTHIQHLAVVTLDEAGTILKDADLVVIDGRIAHLGKAPKDLVADEVIDGSGLMHNQELQTLDEVRILHEAEQRAQAMVRRGMQAARAYKT